VQASYKTFQKTFKKNNIFNKYMKASRESVNIYILDCHRRWKKVPESQVAGEPTKSESVPKERVPSSGAA
jgi:hypothetical protein